MLDLVAVDEFLLEEAVLVVDAVADGGKVERGERVEEARGEAAEAAVAQPHVLLGVAQRGQNQGRARGRRRPASSYRPVLWRLFSSKRPDEIFEREVVDPAHVAVVVHALGGDEAFENAIAHRHGGGDPPIADGGRAGIARQGVLQMVQDGLLERLGAGGGRRPGQVWRGTLPPALFRASWSAGMDMSDVAIKRCNAGMGAMARPASVLAGPIFENAARVRRGLTQYKSACRRDWSRAAGRKKAG